MHQLYYIYTSNKTIDQTIYIYHIISLTLNDISLTFRQVKRRASTLWASRWPSTSAGSAKRS